MISLRLDQRSHLTILRKNGLVEVDNLVKQINEELALLPQSSETKAMATRLARKNANEVWPTITELFFSAECVRRGFEVELHPITASGKKPELMAKKGDNSFILEVRSLLPPVRDEVESRVFAALQNQAKKILGQNSVHVEVTPQGPITGSFSVRRLAHVLREISIKFNSGLGSDFREEVDKIPFRFHFFYLHTVGPSIGWTKGAGRIHEVPRLRNAIAKKAGRYTLDNKPFVIVLDSQDWFRVSSEQLNWALYGNQVIHFNLPKVGEITDIKSRMTRTGDGIFTSRKHTRISAVVFHIALWENKRVVHRTAVYHNAFAKNPLPEVVFQGMSQYVVREDALGQGHYEWIDGKGDSF